MNKEELIDAMSDEALLTKAATRKALDAFMNVITNTLKKGERVGLVGFGSWTVVKRNARLGRNPSTGKKMKIPAKKVVKFKVGSKLVVPQK